MNFITEAVKAVAQAITNASPPDVHHALYAAVMDASSTFSASLGQRVCPDGRGPKGALA
jgi:hypothetical protein